MKRRKYIDTEKIARKTTRVTLLSILAAAMLLIFPISLVPAQDAATTEDSSTQSTDAAESTGDTEVAAVPEQEIPAEPVNEKKPRIDAFRPVVGLENWRYDYDISEYDKGKYNLIIKGTDKAGNFFEEGPYNIFVDPDSDLSIVNISNPSPDMRVTGNLNIVGTCVDDDGVSRVEVKIGDEEYAVAEGSDFWSYFLDTKSMLDGYYTIIARGIDINGKPGIEHEVSFNLDRFKPKFAFTSHENGALVNGKFTLSGTVADRNGISNVQFSRDGGETYEELKYKGPKDGLEVTFDVKIDTLELVDGAQVYWFRATDNTGSEEQAAFLFFVDNKEPVLTILYPTEDGQENGAFTVAGKVEDEIGVQSLTWQIGKAEPVDIPLSPGDPYWTQNFDYLGQDETDITFVLTDLTGNFSTVPLNLALDTEGDLPILTLSYPDLLAQPLRVKEDRLSGYLQDDDGVQGIVYSFDGGDEISVATGQAFDIAVEPLTSGTHELSIQGIDINGTKGNPIVFEFERSLEPPKILFQDLTDALGIERSFTPGAEVVPMPGMFLHGHILFKNPPKSVSYSFNGGESSLAAPYKAQGEGNFTISLPIPEATIPYGFVDFTVQAIDAYDQVSTYASYIFVRNLSRIQADHGITFLDSRIGAGGDVIIERGDVLKGNYIGYPIDSIVIDPPSDIIDVRADNGQLEIRALSEGKTERTYIQVTSDRGTVFRSKPYVFIIDSTPPAIILDQQAKSDRYSGSFQLSGKITDAIGPTESWFEFNGETTPLSLSDDGSFSARLSLRDLTETGFSVAVGGRDSVGNEVREYLIINNTPRYVADPESNKAPVPTASVVFPVSGAVLSKQDMVNDKLYVGGVVTGVPKVDSILFSLDKGDERTMSGNETFELELAELAPGQHSIAFRATAGTGESSTTGKTSTITFTITKSELELSVDQVVVPAENTRVYDFQPGMVIESLEKTAIAGLTSGSASISSGTYRFDDSEPVTLRTTEAEGGGRSISITLPAQIELGYHEIEISITSEYDKITTYKSFFYIVEPVGDRKIYETEGIFLADSRFTHAGNAASGPIVVSRGESINALFNGRTIEQIALNQETDLFSIINTGKELTLRAEQDGYIEGLGITLTTIDGDVFTAGPFDVRVDGQAPVISLVEDYTGRWVQNSIVLKGSVSDNVRISSIELAVGTDIFQPILLPADEESISMQGELSFEVPLENIPDGDLLIQVLAADEAGNTTIERIYLRKDATPPAAVQITPLDSDTVNGYITIAGRANDAGVISSVEFSTDGEDYITADGLKVFCGKIDLTLFEEIPESMQFRVTDAAGNVGLFKPILDLDLESDKPVVQIQLPGNDALIRTFFTVSGMAFDDDGIQTIYYRIDDGEFIPIEGANNFEIDLSLDQVLDNEHSIDVKAEDLGGVMSEIETMTFRVSKAEPVSLLTSPSIEETVKGRIVIEGRSTDKNDINEVLISFDNGNTFNRSEGLDEWIYALDTRTLLDGTYSILIRAADNYGVAGLYTTLINVDNTPPLIELTTPNDGQEVADT
ncbi:MAG: hypothetical protein HN368_05260, partial [Spirochaetales bacterium]|nr:hypothetical protein [Spirochaetales bacterium]